MDWKKTIATDHTDGEPPRRGRTRRVNIGCTENRSNALAKTAATKTVRTSLGPPSAESPRARADGRSSSIQGSPCRFRHVAGAQPGQKPWNAQRFFRLSDARWPAVP